MIFSNNTLINPEAVADDIPIIHGTDFYIDEQGFVCTYNQTDTIIIDSNGLPVKVTSLKQITENLFVINNYLAYRMSTDQIVVSKIATTRSIYKGAFQGIVGFNEAESSYHFMNNTSQKSGVKFTGRLNELKHLEIQIGSNWFVPNGEFRCWIGDTFYNVNSQLTLPNSFGETFEVDLSGWTECQMEDTTDYIKDALVQGNTLYLSTRKHVIGSAPYDWTVVNEKSETTVWSKDTRIIGGNLYGEPSATNFFIVNYTTDSVYYVSGDELQILNTYEHQYNITACCVLDKQILAIVDRQFLTAISFYQQLNNFLLKTVLQYEFKQMSAYEDLPTTTFFEEVSFIRDLNTIALKSNYRKNLLIYLIGNKVSSICFTSTEMILTDWDIYKLSSGYLTKYGKVEDNATYEDLDSLNTLYENCIYIGSDLEPSDGGSTLRDTEILFEGKIAIEDVNDMIMIESSGDKPVSIDYPVRTNQSNPYNDWYLYSKLLRLPISYTDWFKITLMPTTKIYAIRLVNSSSNNSNKSKKSKRR